LILHAVIYRAISGITFLALPHWYYCAVRGGNHGSKVRRNEWAKAMRNDGHKVLLGGSSFSARSSLANKTVVQLRPKSTTGNGFLLEYIRDFRTRVWSIRKNAVRRFVWVN